MSPGIAVVSGRGRGIGRAAALALATGGHWVCVNDTGVSLDGTSPGPEPAERVAAEIEAAGGRARAAPADARTPEAARRLVAEVEAWAGAPATVLVHAAGTLRDGMVHKAGDADWAEVLGAHLAVGVELTRAMAPAVRTGRYGRIVYIGGAAGLVGVAGQAAYAVAKAGLFGLMRAVALEMAGRDVCVNYVTPFAFTRMTESIPPLNDTLRAYLEWARHTSPADVAPLIAWLCSDAAAGVTGQVLGAPGQRVEVWSQPRPLASVGGVEAVAALAPHLAPLESEFDLFSAAGAAS